MPKIDKYALFLPFETIFTKFLAHESISWLQIPKEEYLGLRLREKNHGVDQLEKSLRSFKKNSRKKPNFFVILNFDPKCDRTFTKNKEKYSKCRIYTLFLRFFPNKIDGLSKK